MATFSVKEWLATKLLKVSATTEHTVNEEMVGHWMQYLQTASVNQHLSALNEYQCVSAERLAINQRQTSSKELSTVTLG